ncbi:MAG: acyl-CoA dehydrogenase [Corynebacteriales bacterium]|nr:acyl-CoA dehydrogenase [Mycobacteriales bacterium]
MGRYKVDYALGAADESYVQEIRALGARLTAQDIIARDAAGLFSREAWKELAQAGLAGLPVSAEYGGKQASAQLAVAALSALGRTFADNGLMFALGAHLWACVDPINNFGTQTQKSRWLPGLADGSLIGAHAATEPQAGSDAGAIKTVAEKTATGWRLNGLKTYVTNAPVADVFLVSAITSPERGTLGMSIFVVPRITSGLVIGPVIDKAGMRTAQMSEVHFDDCEVPADALLGAEGAGMAIFTATMLRERSFINAPIVGVLQRLADQSMEYAKTREQFGTRIATFQAVTNRIADMRVRSATAELLMYRIAWLSDTGQIRAEDAAMMKLHSSEAFMASATDAMRIHGAFGYTTAAELERMQRDAMGALLYSGTSDIQRNIIARAGRAMEIRRAQ